MKLKYLYQIPLCIGLVAVLHSCSKKLDITPQGAPTSSTYWRTEQDAQLGVNAMYAYLDQDNFYGRGLFWFINASDDMVTGRVKPEADNIRNFNSSYIGGSYMEPQWQWRYAIIRSANDVIRHVPTMSIDEAKKKQFLGEAYFNSGLMYFQLAANYGDSRQGVPLVTRENMDDSKATPRAENVTVNYNYIISELKNAAQNLSHIEDMSTDNYGRPHKVAAWGYLAKTYLYMKDYANAILYADSVINQGNRDLLSDFGDVFKAENNYSKEYVWSALATPGGSGGWGSILPGVMLENKGWGKYNGWGYYMPTKELYDAYVSGDKRRDITILKPGDHFTYFGDDMVYSSLNSLSGYQFRKYMDPFKYKDAVGTTVSPNGDNPTTNLNVPLMRFAEVLLIKAEAAIMLKGAGTGDTELNRIRVRAGLSPKTGMTMEDLKRERRCELTGEFADRHRDLVRWGDASAAYAIPAHGSNGQVVWPARKFDPIVNAVWAVPQKEIDNSGGVIKQNAGW